MFIIGIKKKFIMDVNNLTLKQRQLIFFGLILPLSLGLLGYSIYNIYYFEPEYIMYCAGDEYKTNNLTKLDIQMAWCKENVLPKYNQYNIYINMSYLFNDTNVTL